MNEDLHETALQAIDKLNKQDDPIHCTSATNNPKSLSFKTSTQKDVISHSHNYLSCLQ